MTNILVLAVLVAWLLKNTRNLGSILHGACTFGRRETSEIEAEYCRHIACCLLDEVGPTERHSERKRDELNVRQRDASEDRRVGDTTHGV